MKITDLIQDLGNFWKEFSRIKLGLVGMTMLLAFVVMAVIGPWLVPFEDAANQWHNISYWQDNPEKSPPAWTNLFASSKVAETRVIRDFTTDETAQDSTTLVSYSLTYDYQADLPPSDLVPHFQGNGQVPVKVEVTRPDGVTIEIYKEMLDMSEGSDQRVSVDRTCRPALYEFLNSVDPLMGANVQIDLMKPLTVLFSKASSTMISKPEPLRGVYTVTITGMLVSEDAAISKPSLVISGAVSGILGTDIYKRDVFTGVVIGIRWALIIGFLSAIISVCVGVFLGVFAAYFGGVTDWIVNRIYEFVYLMPVIPFLIVLSAIFNPSIWTMIIIICIFFWVGPYKPVYAMALQIREETYVEASRALGSGRLRIIFKHIIPILLPFSFAVMALTIPGVIVYEASVSLLGLGDATIVTWGQLLNDAFKNGAVISNLWWWVVSPGLMIALMGMSFAFLGTALDKVLHPKLKTR